MGGLDKVVCAVPDLANNTLFQAILSGVIGAVVGTLFTLLLTRRQGREIKRQREILEAQLNLSQYQYRMSQLQPILGILSNILTEYVLAYPPSSDKIQEHVGVLQERLIHTQEDLGRYGDLPERIKQMTTLGREYLTALDRYTNGEMAREDIDQLRVEAIEQVEKLTAEMKASK